MTTSTMLELEKRIQRMLHEVHEVQRGMLQEKVTLHKIGKYLNPHQQTMTALAGAQQALESAELSIGKLIDASKK